jgi:hypothetical protein
MEIGEEHGRALKDLAGQLEAFVGGEGDLEGARFADELSDEDMDSDSDEEKAPTAEEREERLRNLVPALPEGEWGARGGDSKAEAEAEDDDVEMAEAPSKGTVAGTAFGDALLTPKMRPPRFEAVHFDGVESDSSDEDEDLPPQGTLGRHIAEMKWGDSPPKEATIEEIDDDENEDEEDRKDRQRKKALTLDDDIDEQMRRRVWGGDDEDEDADEGMEDVEEGKPGTEERDGPDEEEFLRFARDALGIDGAMWDNILAQRRERGGKSSCDALRC